MGNKLALETNEIARLVYLLLILLAIGGWLIVSLRNDLSKTIQRAIIWFLIFFGLFGAYGIWTDMSGKFGLDAQYDEIRKGVYTIKKAADGHFYSTAIINGKKIRLLVDTGATKTLLSLEDAKRLDFKVSELAFSNPIQTANGISYSATYRVDEFEWFGKQFENMEIQITDANLVRSLLGMDVINRSRALVISGDLLNISF